MNTQKNEELDTAGAKTAGGSWLDWRDAWRAMGRTEADIAAEDARREPAPPPPPRAANTSATRRRRERLHGFTRARFDARCERCARLSAYIVKALLRGWRRDPLTPRELFRAAWVACFGAQRLAAEGMARAWRDTWEWVRNIYAGIARERGVSAKSIQSYSHAEDEAEAPANAASDATPARESNTKNKKTLKQPRRQTAEAVCAAFAEIRESASRDSQGSAGTPGAREHSAPAGGGDAPRIPRFTGRLPGRCCWQVWRTMRELKNQHWPATEHLWSGAHAFAWLASVLAAGKRLDAAAELYYDALISWYGRRVASEKNFVPSGMFAELYRRAVELPDFRRKTV